MTLDKAHELIEMHVQLGSGYNRNAVKMLLGDIMRDFGQVTINDLIRRYGLEQKWELKPGTVFTSAFKS